MKVAKRICKRQGGMTWVQIVKDHLEANRYDCLVSNDKKCYCKIGDLFNCAFDACTFNCFASNIKDLPDNYTLWDEELTEAHNG